MKTTKLTNKFAATALAILALAFTASCSKDDAPIDTPIGTPAESESTNLNGELTSNRTLDASKEYKVTGAYRVKSGATLTIPAGTVITSDKGGDKFIVIEMGAKINVNGTSDKPVTMKSQGTAGDWGGLVIAGKGISSAGTDVAAEIGGVVYGGTDAADNSGSINYLIIKDSGAVIKSGSEFNGLSLYSIGSGTKINNVAVINGSDDGIEFYGGSVNATNIYLENNTDDSIDWTEGWNGSISTVYVKLDVAFDSAVEADGTDVKPTINNLTAVSTVAGTGVIIQNASAGAFTGLTLTGFDTDKSFVSKKDGVIGKSTVDAAAAIAGGTYTSSTTSATSFAWAK